MISVSFAIIESRSRIHNLTFFYRFKHHWVYVRSSDRVGMFATALLALLLEPGIIIELSHPVHHMKQLSLPDLLILKVIWLTSSVSWATTTCLFLTIEAVPGHPVESTLMPFQFFQSLSYIICIRSIADVFFWFGDRATKVNWDGCWGTDAGAAGF